MPGRLLSGDRELEQAELLARAARAAAALRSLGVGSEDTVALVLRNDFALFEASLAARMLGASPVPVNWHFTPEEAGYVLRDCGARAVVVHADLRDRLGEALPGAVPRFVVPTPPEIAQTYGVPPAACRVPADERSWSEWIDGFEPLPPREIPPPSSMIYTSGTTGRPKGVRRFAPSPEQDAIGRSIVGSVLGMTGEVRTVVCGPMYHSAPNAYGLVAAMLGGTVVLQPRFDPEELLALIERHRVTHLNLVPIMLVRLLRLPEEVRRRYDVSSLRWVVHGAAPCPAEVKRAMIEWWGPVIHEFYGATEVAIVAACSSEEWLAHPGTVGRVLPHAEVKVLSPDGAELPIGEPGAVYCRFGGVADFTYEGAAKARREVERHGLIHVGDVGYLDADGFLYLCDRAHDMVISGGVNIYPAEIEAEILRHEAVLDCAVFGIPDPEYGEALCALVQRRPGAALEADALREFLKRSLAGFKVPGRIEFRDELPREDSGKLFKRKLREPYWEGTGRRI